MRLVVALNEYVTTSSTGHVLASPADISWGPDILVQPDVFVASLSEVRTLDWTNVKTLLPAIEVLSHSTARADHFTKRRLFQEIGIPAYWIVDGDERTVEVWTPEQRFPTVERERLVWQPDRERAQFTVELSELFRPL